MRYITIACLLLFPILSSAQDREIEYSGNNTVYYEIFGAGLFFGSVNYDYTFYMSKSIALRPRAGLAVYGGLFAIADLNVILGNQKHSGEIGFGGTTLYLLTGENAPDLYIKPGYRFKNSKGFMFNASVYIFTVRGSFNELIYIPGVGIGYAF